MVMSQREFLRRKSWRKKLVTEKEWLSSTPVKSYHANSTSRTRMRRSTDILEDALDAAAGFVVYHDNLTHPPVAKDSDNYFKTMPESSSTSRSEKNLPIKWKENERPRLVKPERNPTNRSREQNKTKKCVILESLTPQVRALQAPVGLWSETCGEPT